MWVTGSEVTYTVEAIVKAFLSVTHGVALAVVKHVPTENAFAGLVAVFPGARFEAAVLAIVLAGWNITLRVTFSVAGLCGAVVRDALRGQYGAGRGHCGLAYPRGDGKVHHLTVDARVVARAQTLVVTLVIETLSIVLAWVGGALVHVDITERSRPAVRTIAAERVVDDLAVGAVFTLHLVADGLRLLAVLTRKTH